MPRSFLFYVVWVAAKGWLGMGFVSTPSFVRPSVVLPTLSRPSALSSSSSPPSEDTTDPLDELSDERKANLFQFLLRDIQVEGTPLLSVDADQVFTLQAALWTTMAEMATQSEESKACLIFESIPISALRCFVDEFMLLKQQDRLQTALPDLQRFNVSLVGRGVGPAIVIEAGEFSDAESFVKPVEVDINKYSAVMKMFVDRMVAEKQISGYPSAGGTVPESLQDATVPAMEFRFCQFAETCHALSSFWNSICELLSTPGEFRTHTLSFPGETEFSRAASLAEIISWSLCLYQADELFEILHLHPNYERSLVHPADQPAQGHLPPLTWLPAMVQQSGVADMPELSRSDVDLLNYARRAPLPSVCITPVELWESGKGPGDDVVSLTVDGMKVQASGCTMYSNQLREVVDLGEDHLADALNSEAQLLQ